MVELYLKQYVSFVVKKYDNLEDANKCEKECLRKYLPELPEEIICPVPSFSFAKNNGDKNYF